VLRASVVGEHATEFQVGQLVHELRERHRLISGRDSTARAHRNVNDDVRSDAGRLCGLGQITCVLREIDCLDEVAMFLADIHRALNLRA
jgi:hypothetical protein